MNTGRYKKEIQEVTDLSDERKLKPKAAIQKAKSNSMCIKFIFSLQILQEMEYQTTWPASWETCMQVKK